MSESQDFRFSSDDLKTRAADFRRLADFFLEEKRQNSTVDSLEALRWNVNMAKPVQCAKLLFECLDDNVFSDLRGDGPKPEWDLRAYLPVQVKLMAFIALQDSPRIQQALVAFPDEALASIREDLSDEEITQLSRPFINFEDDGHDVTETLKRIKDDLAKRVERGEDASEKTLVKNNGLICMWFAAIRWWLLKADGRLRSDTCQVFHPWVDKITAREMLGKTELSDLARKMSPLPHTPEIDKKDPAQAFFLLQAHADIQADACVLLAELLDREAKIRETPAAKQTESTEADPPDPPDVNGDDKGGQLRYVFRKSGDMWEVRYGGEHGFFNDLKGFCYIAKLLQSPNPQKEISAIDLAGGDSLKQGQEQSYDSVADKQAVANLRNRLQEIPSEIEEANQREDIRQVEKLEKEKECIMQELKSSLGIGGKLRQIGPTSNVERARKAVWNAIATAYKKMEEADPPLSNLVSHLRNTNSVSALGCAYRPSPDLEWVL